MDIGTRVKKLRKSKGWTQEKLSERTLLSRARIAQLETDPTAEVRNDSFISLARAFGLSCEQLIAPDLFTSSLLTELEFQPKANKVPMISWESLPIFVEGTLIIDGSEWIGCPYDLSEKSCVLEVQDELMTAIHGRSYPKGALIFVDAEREP